jgi:hypothetical protein
MCVYSRPDLDCQICTARARSLSLTHTTQELASTEARLSDVEQREVAVRTLEEELASREKALSDREVCT